MVLPPIAFRKELREHIYTDAKSVAAWIRSTLGVEYTPQGVVDLLNRIGFTYKKTTEVPCESDASGTRSLCRRTIQNPFQNLRWRGCLLCRRRSSDP